MEVVVERCCGIDVHHKSLTACVLVTALDGTVERHCQTFSTMTEGLLALDDWLESLAVTQVAIESTGVYWQPVFNVLEATREVLLVNPRHCKAVPGRKTDVQDAEWLADLLRHGLLRASFIPPAPIRELREVLRYRKTLVRERAQEVNRLHKVKVLEGANLKLGVVASDILGASGRQMLTALVAGEADPAALAELAKGRLRAKLPALRQALTGRVKPHHRLLIERLLAHIDFLEESMAVLQTEVAERLDAVADAVTLLQTIPGVGELAAATIVAEIGTDMSRFPSAAHLASWAGLCPGNHESAGKRSSGKPTGGNPWLKGVLTEVAWSISRLRQQTYLGAQYHRLARRRGKRRAVVAVAHSVVVIVYHLLATKQPYQDLGADYFDQRDKERLERHHVTRLRALGYEVELKPQAA